jgi:hypothetical protein
MINILEVNPNPNDAMSLYRGRGPLIRLQKKYRDEIQIHPGGRQVSTEWDFLNLFDMVFIMRPSNNEHLNLIKACKSFDIPVWSDYDDLLSDIPVNNPAYFVSHNSKEYQQRIEEILKLSDFITFSTPKLKEVMGKNVLKKSYVIPNGLDRKLFKTPKVVGTDPKILWRGGSTHVRDIFEFRDPIVPTLRKSEWVMEFMGHNPIEITDYINAVYTPYMSKADYFNYLTRINGKLSIVPLSHRNEDITFNQCKSNIAWIESTYAGLVVLAPDWEEWRRPGIINYKDKADFGVKLKSMMNGEYDLESLRQASWKYIKEELNLETLNKVRYDLIKKHLKEQ